ncbi:putative transporter SVOPL isoform X2 [Bolinopsis microptera]|uniref:putative transporter SVOPL isoform X2 n=1 Tax=Bolinopsis microptera TaxID=2820187 RepID=UPI00307A5FEC
MFLVALGLIGIADSMQACYIAIVLPVLKCHWSLTATQIAVVTSLSFTGTGLGGIVIGPLSDRKPTAMMTSFVLFLSMVSSSFSPDVYVFLFFAIVGGLCVGGSLSIAYTYWAEVSSMAHRAAGVVVITMFWNSGMTTSNGFALLVLNRIGWRLYSIIMSLPALVAVIILCFLPESPKFLNSNRKHDSTTPIKASLKRKLRAANTNLNLDRITILREPGTDPQTGGGNSIMRSFATICSDGLRWDTLKILASYACLQMLYKGLLYVVATMFAQNFCGLKVGGSMSDISSDSGVEGCATLSNGDLISGILLSAAFFPSTIVSVYLTKIIGASRALITFAVCCLISCVILTICLPVPIGFINLGMLIFSVAAMSLVFYMILPQMYPTVARNSGFGLVDGVGKLVASVGIFAITAALDSSVRGALGILIIICLLINVQVFFLKVKSDELGSDSEIMKEDNSQLPYVD